MTPLGHTGISLLVGIGLTKITPNINPSTILIPTVIGGNALDLDLLYRFYQKGTKVFDGTIGQHRFFPSHTPLTILIVSNLIALVNFYWAVFFALGALLHLFLDTLFFPEGVNFLFPFRKKMVHLLTIKTRPFWAPRPISQVDGWWKNYFISPLFWVAEVLPSIAALVLLLQLT